MKNGDRWLLPALSLLAAALRLPGLGGPLAGDEAISFARYSRLFWFDAIRRYADTNQHTLFTILSNFCWRSFGENEFWFRFPAFAAGVLSVPLLYHLGRRLFGDWRPALLASLLMTFSDAHLTYSQQGRGYALTSFLATALILAVTGLIESGRKWIWGGVAIVSGTGMALTLPSNAFFLAAAAAYCAAFYFPGNAGNARVVKSVRPVLLTFLILFLCAGAYFYTIYEDIESGIRHHAYVRLTPGLAAGTARFLISPWPLWLAFFAGWSLLRGAACAWRWPLVFIFLAPAALSLATQIPGFPRTYIYLQPFLWLLVAWGAVDIYARVAEWRQAAAYALAAGFFLWTSSAALNFLAVDYYPRRLHVRNAAVSEARQIADYARAHISARQLLVIPVDEHVLNMYLEPVARQAMLDIARGAVPEKLFFLSRQDVPPAEYAIGGHYAGEPLRFPPDTLKPGKKIGGYIFYEFAGTASRFIPPVYDADYETRLEAAAPGVSVEHAGHVKFAGGRMLVLRRQAGADIFVGSPVVKTVDIQSGRAFLLFVYAQRYGQKSKAWMDSGALRFLPPPMGFLNPYLGRIEAADQPLAWQMVFILSRLEAGRQGLREVFDLREEIAGFDGIQSFLLSPP